MHYEMMTVTPELAQRWLREKNKRNRNISLNKVAAYADDILAGRWHHTHQNAIGFYKDGNLADGQHRLAAIAKAQRSVEFMVWWGLDDKAAYGIDAHRMRAVSDQIKIAGGNDWINKEAIATARVMMASKGGFNKSAKASPQEIAEFCNAHRAALQFALENFPRHNISSPVRGAVALAFYYEDREKLVQWCEIMKTGMGAAPLIKTVLILRERILRDPSLSHGGPKREYLCRITMRSIQAYCADQTLMKLVEPKERIYEIPA